MRLNLLRTLFSFSGTLGRWPYVVVALCGVAVKHVLDAWVAYDVFGRPWTPLNYLVPLGVPLPAANLAASDARFVLTMLAVSIPFAWIGVAITTKRFRAIGWPLWMVALFFVPIANIVSFAVAVIWPDAREADSEFADTDRLSRFMPEGALQAALVAAVGAAAFGIVLVAFASRALDYGWGLFAAVPFAQGVLSTYAFNARARRTFGATVLVTLLSVALVGVALLAFAFEGVICIAMATPLAGALALIGCAFAYTVMHVRRRDAGVGVLVACLFAPGILGAEAALPREAPLYAVRTGVDIDAPPATVWRNVIAFRDLPAPTEWFFRDGIAYPVRAHIVGNGVGATRYCEFSTGDFVEPITAWKPGRRLAFNVVRNPEPMREWSPYPGLDTPHLHHFMMSQRGQFELIALPNGRTRLVGTTWYRHHLWPATYWALWADAIVHRIHLRVLEHIKDLAETGS